MSDIITGIIEDITGKKFRVQRGKYGGDKIEIGGELVPAPFAFQVNPDNPEDRALWRASCRLFYYRWIGTFDGKIDLEEANLFNSLLASELGRDTGYAFRFADGEWIDDMKIDLEKIFGKSGRYCVRYAVVDMYTARAEKKIKKSDGKA